MEYEVRITVVQTVTVAVEAANMVKAEEAAELGWRNNKYADTSTHSRRRREQVKFETLYPDLALVR